MPYRKSHVSTLCLTSSLALLACILVVPIKTPGFVTASFRPDRLRLNFALPPSQPTTYLTAAMAADALLEEDALPYEMEEQERADALDEPRVSFRIPCSFQKIPDHQLIGPSSILSLYPLRC